mgnify:CR=1 FL=1
MILLARVGNEYYHGQINITITREDSVWPTCPSPICFFINNYDALLGDIPTTSLALLRKKEFAWSFVL